MALSFFCFSNFSSSVSGISGSAGFLGDAFDVLVLEEDDVDVGLNGCE